MKKACFRLFLCAALIVALSALNRADAANVSVSSMNVKVNGVPQTVQAYLIDGNNYFKLRDLAMMLRETPNRFEVGYDSATKKVALTSGQDYTSVGGELTSGQDLSYTCKISPSTLVIDGEVRTCRSYNIGGNNYFKLRDLSSSLKLSVAYDRKTRTVLIRSVGISAKPPIPSAEQNDVMKIHNASSSVDNGRQTKTVYSFQNKELYYEISEEFPQQKRRKVTTYTMDDAVYSIVTMEFDDAGNLTKWELSLENGMIIRYTLSFYDEQNRWIRDESYYGDGMMDGYSEAEYGEDGRPVKERNYMVREDGESELAYVLEFRYEGGALHKVVMVSAGGQVISEQAIRAGVITYGHYKFN